MRVFLAGASGALGAPLARGHQVIGMMTMAVVAINGWNRLCIAFRAEPGTYRPGMLKAG